MFHWSLPSLLILKDEVNRYVLIGPYRSFFILGVYKTFLEFKSLSSWWSVPAFLCIIQDNL